jgi:hypothetical protein
MKNLMTSSSTSPQQKKQLEDAEKKLLLLGDQMNNGALPQDVASKLQTLVHGMLTCDSNYV